MRVVRAVRSIAARRGRQLRMAHLLPVMLRELADHKRAGPSCRRRSCGLRIIEPKSDALPDWLDLDVPDDRSSLRRDQ
ncbi:hypothetical protein OHB54_45450 [Streptomyces sp. NBC_01007]|nr:hypothetical protein OHB54_45450 [Streptomyces sp. NBC_01007]